MLKSGKLKTDLRAGQSHTPLFSKIRIHGLFATVLVMFAFSMGAPSVHAGDLLWSGVYRIEGYNITNSELGDKNRQKAFGLHHLTLMPKIVAADGLNIEARFDIFNSSAYPNSVLGQVWGDGVDNAPVTDVPRTQSHSEKAEDLKVNLLYLTLVQEFGSLLVGRAPVHFGLGASFNSGLGMFDHWIENRDLVGYKIVMGNMYLMPMYAKVHEASLTKNSDDITDLIIQFQYENPENDLQMGAIYSDRRAGEAGNDAPAPGLSDDDVFGGTGAVRSGRYQAKQLGVYVLKDAESFRAGVEAQFLSGNTGVDTNTGKEVDLSGLGIAGEFEWRPAGSKWKLGTKAGYATGDNPETDDSFEGFIFNRNYDVAFLLFNHPVGQADFLRTGLIKGHPGTGTIDQPDTEAISNVMYLSPYVHYQWKDRWSLESALTLGILNQSPLAGENVDKSLGYEFDFAVNFRPNERVTWINQVGLLFPGAAFEGGALKLDKSFAYGLTTKAAISF